MVCCELHGPTDLVRVRVVGAVEVHHAFFSSCLHIAFMMLSLSFWTHIVISVGRHPPLSCPMDLFVLAVDVHAQSSCELRVRVEDFEQAQFYVHSAFAAGYS